MRDNCTQLSIEVEYVRFISESKSERCRKSGIGLGKSEKGIFFLSKLSSKEKREKKKAILPGLGVLKARFWSKILPEWVEIL